VYSNLTYRNYQITSIPVRYQFIKIEVIEIDTFVRDGTTAVITNIQSGKIIAEIQGQAISGSINYDANNPMRRSCNLTMVVIKDDLKVSHLANIWLNKKLRVWIGLKDNLNKEVIWNNTGEYLINNPSYTYTSSSKTLSISGIDLMAKLNGTRGGKLEGVEYIIPVDSDIKSSMISLLYQYGIEKYKIKENENTRLTPYEIRNPVGSTYDDILKKLAEIEPYHEYFFDANGTFVYEKTPVDDDDVAIINDNLLSKILIDENVSYNFEEVKNVVEVLGKAHQVDYFSPKHSVTYGLGTQDLEDETQAWDAALAVGYPYGKTVKYGDAVDVTDKYFKKESDSGIAPFLVIDGVYDSWNSFLDQSGEIELEPVNNKFYLSDQKTLISFDFFSLWFPAVITNLQINIKTFLNQVSLDEIPVDQEYSFECFVDDPDYLYRYSREPQGAYSKSSLATTFGISFDGDFNIGESLQVYASAYAELNPNYSSPSVVEGKNIVYNLAWNDVTSTYFLKLSSLDTMTFRGDGNNKVFYPLDLNWYEHQVAVKNSNVDYSGKYNIIDGQTIYSASINNKYETIPQISLIDKAFFAYDLGEVFPNSNIFEIYGNGFGKILTSINPSFSHLEVLYSSLVNTDDVAYSLKDRVFDFKLRFQASGRSGTTGNFYYQLLFFPVLFSDNSKIEMNIDTGNREFNINFISNISKLVFDNGYAPPAVETETEPDNIIVNYYGSYKKTTIEKELSFASLSENVVYFDHALLKLSLFSVKRNNVELFKLPIDGTEDLTPSRDRTAFNRLIEMDYNNNRIVFKNAPTLTNIDDLPLNPRDGETYYVNSISVTGYFWYKFGKGWVRDVATYLLNATEGAFSRILATNAFYRSEEDLMNPGTYYWVLDGADDRYNYFRTNDVIFVHYYYPNNFIYLPPGDKLGFVTPDYQQGDVFDAKISINGGVPVAIKNSNGSNAIIPVFDITEDNLYGDYFVLRNNTTVVLTKDDVVSPYDVFIPIENEFVYTADFFKEWIPNRKITIKSPLLSIIEKSKNLTKYLIKHAIVNEPYQIPKRGEYLFARFLSPIGEDPFFEIIPDIFDWFSSNETEYNNNSYKIQYSGTFNAFKNLHPSKNYPYASAKVTDGGVNSFYYSRPHSFIEINIRKTVGYNFFSNTETFTIDEFYGIIMPQINIFPSIRINQYNPVKIITREGTLGVNLTENFYPISIANQDYSFYTNDFVLFLGNQQPRSVQEDLDPNSPFNTELNGEIRDVIQEDGIYSDELAVQRAKYELWLKTRLNDGFGFSTIPIYWGDVNVKVNHPSIKISQKEEVLEVLTKNDLILLSGVELGNKVRVMEDDLIYECYSLTAANDFFVPVSGLSSGTTVTVGTGDKAFNTNVPQSSTNLIIGQRIRVIRFGGSEYMEGFIKTFTGTSLVVAVDLVFGSGSHTGWYFKEKSSWNDFWRVANREYIVKTVSCSIDKGTSMDFSSIKFYEEYESKKVETIFAKLNGNTISWQVSDSINKYCSIFAIIDSEYILLGTVPASSESFTVDVSRDGVPLLPELDRYFFILKTFYDNENLEDDEIFRPSEYSNVLLLEVIAPQVTQDLIFPEIVFNVFGSFIASSLYMQPGSSLKITSEFFEIPQIDLDPFGQHGGINPYLSLVDNIITLDPSASVNFSHPKTLFIVKASSSSTFFRTVFVYAVPDLSNEIDLF